MPGNNPCQRSQFCTWRRLVRETADFAGNETERKEKRHVGVDDARVLSLPPAHRLTMLLRSGIQTLDAYRPTFEPNLDVAALVFSHVQCVKTRVNLAMVSRTWRDASKTADAYPLRFNFDALPHMYAWRRRAIIRLLDNDEALSLPYERVVGLLGDPAKNVCDYAAFRGSVRLLKWARENDRAWSVETCTYAALNGQLLVLQYLHENGCPWDKYTCTSAASNGHLPVLQYLHENGCPWDSWTCEDAAKHKHWDCLQYLVDNKCDECWYYAEQYAKHLR